jgi:hypothetical protein
MKRLAVVIVVAMSLCCFTLSKTQAALTADITVTVSLAAAISVTVDPTTWVIGPVALNSTTTSPTSYTATVGYSATRLEIKGADVPSGWAIGPAPASNVFEMVVATGTPVILTNGYQLLTASVPGNRYESFDLTYYAPTGDTFGDGVAQGFNVTLQASTPL